MIPITKVKQLVIKHQSLEKELASGKIDKKDFAFKSKEYSSLGEVIKSAKEYLDFENQKKKHQEEQIRREQEQRRLKEWENKFDQEQKLKEEEEILKIERLKQKEQGGLDVLIKQLLIKNKLNQISLRS